MNTQYTVESPEGKQIKNVSTSLHSTTQTVVFYLYKQCKITTRQTGSNLHNTKSSHDTTKNLMAFAYEQKIFKKILQIFQVRMFISPVIGPKCQVNWTRWVEMRTKLLRGSGEGMKPRSLSEGTLSQLLLRSIVWNQFQLSNEMKFSLTFTTKSLDKFYFTYKCQCVVFLVHM